MAWKLTIGVLAYLIGAFLLGSVLGKILAYRSHQDKLEMLRRLHAGEYQDHTCPLRNRSERSEDWVA